MVENSNTYKIIVPRGPSVLLQWYHKKCVIPRSPHILVLALIIDKEEYGVFNPYLIQNIDKNFRRLRTIH